MSVAVNPVSLLLSILTMLALYGIFRKAGEAGWKCLIPLYNTYILYKIAWNGAMFLLPLGAFLLLSILGALLSAPGLLMVPAVLAAHIISVICYVKLARAFGKSGWYALGLVLLPPVFLAILGFGRAVYWEPQT